MCVHKAQLMKLCYDRLLFLFLFFFFFTDNNKIVVSIRIRP